MKIGETVVGIPAPDNNLSEKEKLNIWGQSKNLAAAITALEREAGYEAEEE